MNKDFLIEAVNRKRRAEEDAPRLEREFTMSQFQKVAESQAKATELLIRFLQAHEPKVVVKNFPNYPTLDNSNVVKAIENLPKPKDIDHSDIVKGLKELKSQNDLLLKAIKSLEMNPVVNTPAPVVTVKEPDLSPITKAIKAIPKPDTVDLSGLEKQLKDLAKQMASVQKEIKDKPTPVAPLPDTDPLVRFAAADIEESSTVEYRGYRSARGDWYIRKWDKTAGTVRFAFGNEDYTTNWTNRLSLTYGYFGT